MLDMESKEKKNLFYCYNEAVAVHLIRFGLTPAFHSVNKNTQSSYWAFERGEALDEGLDAWQKKRWAMKPKQTEEAEHD